MTDYPILTATTFLPLVGAVAILLIGGERLARWMALGTSLATLAVSAPLYWRFDKTRSDLQHWLAKPPAETLAMIGLISSGLFPEAERCI